MEQNNSKIIPIHNPDEKPSVIAIFKKVCELPATPALPCPSHQGMGTGVGEHGERRPALHWSLAPCLVPASFFHLPSSGSWLCLSASSSLSPLASFLPSQLRCPRSSGRETDGVSVAMDGVG